MPNLQVRIPDALLAALDALCESSGRSRSATVREAIEVITSAGGVRGGVPLTLVSEEDRSLETASRTKKETTSASLQKKSLQGPWLGPYLSAWVTRFGGLANPALIGKYLWPLHELHGPEKTLKHWTNFLTGSDARFVSVPRFAQTFGTWTSSNPDGWRKDPREIRPNETVDQYAQRLSYL